MKRILIVGKDEFKTSMATEEVNVALAAQKIPAIAMSGVAQNLKEAVVVIATANPDLIVLSQCLGEDGRKIIANNEGRLRVVMRPISVREVVEMISH